MAHRAHHFDRTAAPDDLQAILVSTVCHLAVLIGLGCVTLAIEQGHDRVLLATAADEAVEIAEEIRIDQTAPLEASADGAPGGVEPIALFDVAPATSDVADLLDPAETSLQGAGLYGTGLAALTSKQGRLPGTSTFFGVSGYGNSFVYVVDCSGSMGEAGKFVRAREELLYSLHSLDEEQRYYVIFYGDGAYPMDSDLPIDATEEHLAETRQWVEAIEPAGGTNPLPALLIALSLEPDAIYFLSDGKFHPRAISQVRANNRSRRGATVPIHSISFVNRETEALMRSISRGTGGEFRFVK